jgi:hypothetical protein
MLEEREVMADVRAGSQLLGGHGEKLSMKPVFGERILCGSLPERQLTYIKFDGSMRHRNANDGQGNPTFRESILPW